MARLSGSCLAGDPLSRREGEDPRLIMGDREREEGVEREVWMEWVEREGGVEGVGELEPDVIPDPSGESKNNSSEFLFFIIMLALMEVP